MKKLTIKQVASSWSLFTQQYSAHEDGRDYRPKHVELIEIINKVIIVAFSWLLLLLLA